ncbi:PREDICTED: ubiquinone biosynthesis protein COQ9-A, mitochondrial-like isoform X2 [Lupinus angustifolius]|uniref:ubiquinone biosynthesis protein COQ9-A, mitochondrial-like isoform X2 n=1 Tax=Lupinus angustifolius TaxID=3871 RepID=UPI00092E40EA|nr:PREDICTED: ubiquinone biosynthesis protein COQ9-A, mitochondrial-like isoform X2 [Lupinus angustifolius]
MYRTAANRLFSGARCYCNNYRLRLRPLQISIASSRFSTTETQPFTNPHTTNNPIPNTSTIENPNSSDSTSSSSSEADDTPRYENPRARAEYQDEQSRVLQASLPYVIKLGWTEAALIAGARDVGLSPSIIGSLSRKEAALVEAQPINVPTSFKQRAMLVDEIWHAADDNTSNIDWYAKRTVLGGIYSTTEIFMLTDSSPDFRDTWAFLDARVKDAFDLKKTIQEAQYLAEAVSAGLGNSFQGFVGKVFGR